jgi:CheY-like chemotaxis protein
VTTPAPETAPVILIVDDNDDTRLMYEELLSRCGFRVRLAADGMAALASADEVLPSVVVMDLAMPGLNGWEATRRLKTGERTRDVPIIVLTAHALDHYRDVAIAAGCDEFLSKPCSIEHLVAAIRRALAD